MTSTIITRLCNGHYDAITTLALSERNLASGSDDCTICLWSPSQSRSPVNKISLDYPCTSIKFAENKPDLIYASHGTNICSYDLRSINSPIYNVKISEEEINSIDLLESEARLAAGDDSGAVQIVCSDNGQLLRTLNKHDNICSVVHFRPDRSWQIISGGLDCRMVVSDWKESGRAVTIFEMSELLDFPEEEDEAADEESGEYEDLEEEDEGEEEEEEQADSVTSQSQSQDGHSNRPHYSSRWSDLSVSGNNPWQTPSSEGIEEAEEETPADARRTASESSEDAEESDSEPEEDPDDREEPFREPETARVSRRVSGPRQHHVRVHMSRTDAYIASAMSTGYARGNRGMPVNPSMIQALAVSRSGHLVAVGLASYSVELFLGTRKHLLHSESFYGHSRSVSALHMVQEDRFLVSGGNDKCLFLWPLHGADAEPGSELDSGGTQWEHNFKVEAIAGTELAKIYVSDSKPTINMMDLSLC